ncbi:MAG: GTPase HflX [Spirochaetota bacterium]
MKQILHTTETKKETAVLVGIINPQQPKHKAEEYLGELDFLAKTLGLSCEYSFLQKLSRPEPKYFIGAGKVEEVLAYVQENRIDLVIFDDDLSPSQLRNLEKKLQCRIYDRSLLILEIFLQRAQTSQAKTQVELARYQYLMPRLTRMWTHLERQRGGTGTRGGAGEKEIETDRRVIRNQIAVLKKKLQKIDKQNLIQRKSRSKMVRVALVGYTNVGKSTLMNLLSKSKIYAQDELFATVDATVRKVVINRIPFLLSDTVGFIRKLPHHLIESFKSTLNEVIESDILLHVVDISHPAHEEQIAVVQNTLIELGVEAKPTIYVFNKIDQLEQGEESYQISDRSLIQGEGMDKCYISAKDKLKIEAFKEKLFSKVEEKHYKIFPNYLPENGNG